MFRKDEEKSEEIQKSTIIFVMFYILGALSHIPQYFYITANDYWMYKFRSPDEVTSNTSEPIAKTDLQTNFTSYYSVVSHIGVAIGLVSTIFLIKKYSAQARIMTILNALLVLFIITILLAWLETDSWQTTFFAISLLIGGLLSIAQACLLVSTFYLALKFPVVYLGAVLSGQSISGMLSALVQIITLAIGSSSVVTASLYFIVAVIFVVTGEVLFATVLMKHVYYKQQVNKKLDRVGTVFDRHQIFGITKKILPFLISLIVTSGSLVAMNPGVTSLVESENKGYGRWGDTFFVPVCTFLTFSAVDFIGRECAKFHWVRNKYIIMTSAALRLSLVPVLLFCNVQPRKHLDVVFDHDWQYAICISAIAFSGGYMINLCVLSIPTVCKPEEMSIATVIVLFTTILSLAVCGVLSPVLVALV